MVKTNTFEEIIDSSPLRKIELKIEDRTKLRKSDVVLMSISSWNAVAEGWREDIFENNMYACPYKSLSSPYLTLFSNNPSLKYVKIGKQKILGSLIYKSDTKNSNKPKFMYIVSRNLHENINLDELTGDSHAMLQEEMNKDTPKNIYSSWEKGITRIQDTLMTQFPMTKRIIVPIPNLQDGPREILQKVLHTLTNLNNYFVDTEVILASIVKSKKLNEESTTKY